MSFTVVCLDVFTIVPGSRRRIHDARVSKSTISDSSAHAQIRVSNWSRQNEKGSRSTLLQEGRSINTDPQLLGEGKHTPIANQKTICDINMALDSSQQRTPTKKLQTQTKEA
eukprot:1153910-Pelagomonas_calceolata.AAC.2